MAILEEVEREAFSLPEDQRLTLAHKLLSSVESVEGVGDAGADEAWELEIASRLSDLRSGRVKAVPAAEVFARLRIIAPEE